MEAHNGDLGELHDGSAAEAMNGTAMDDESAVREERVVVSPLSWTLEAAIHFNPANSTLLHIVLVGKNVSALLPGQVFGPKRSGRKHHWQGWG